MATNSNSINFTKVSLFTLLLHYAKIDIINYFSFVFIDNQNMCACAHYFRYSVIHNKVELSTDIAQLLASLLLVSSKDRETRF